jgi:hypothetical protein
MTSILPRLYVALGVIAVVGSPSSRPLHAARQSFRVTGEAPPLQPPWVILRFPASVDTTRLEIFYDVGKRPLSFNRIRGRRGEFDYELGIRGDPGTKTHLAAFCHLPGFDYVFFDLDLTADEPVRVVSVTLTQRPMLRVHARVVSPPGQSFSGLTVRAFYREPWWCPLSGRYDCLVSSEELTGATIQSDGSFEVDVPDVLNDSGLARFDEKFRGAVWFDTTMPGSPPTRYFLIAEGPAREFDLDVTPRPEYLANLILHPEIR